MVGRISSAVLVGRDEELALLRTVRRAALETGPTLIIVSGEAGVGKSRLVAEALNEALADGWLVLNGAAIGSMEGSFPFAPFTMALRSVFERMTEEELATVVGAGRPHLARLIPELARPGDERSIGEERYLQGRIFAAMTHTLDRLAVDTPVALLLEDLHWADQSSRSLVGHLMRALHGTPIVVLATVRDEDVPGAAPLAAELAELERRADVVRIRLSSLDEAATLELVRAIGHARLLDADVRRLHRRSGGLPFYIEELLSMGDASVSDDVPPTVREIVLVRFQTFPRATQALLQAAACMGTAMDDRLLVDVAGLEMVDGVAAIRDAVRGHFLVRAAEDRLTFRHDISREAIYLDLLPGERRRLHLALARAIEATPAEGASHGRAAILAVQWDRAGDADQAIAASVAAARALLRAGAWQEAHALSQRALDLWPTVADAPRLAGMERHELLMLTASAAFRGTLIERAIDLVREAIADLGPDPDPFVHGSYLERHGWYAYNGQQTQLSIEAGQASVAVIPAHPPTRERARALSTYSNRLATLDRDAEALDLGLESLLVAKEVDDRAEIGRAMHAVGLARCGLGELDQGVRDLRESLELAAGDAGDELTILAMFDLGWAHWASGQHAEYVTAAQRLERILDDLGLDQIYGAFTTTQGMEARLHTGDWGPLRERRAWLAERHPGNMSAASEYLAVRIAAADGDTDAAIDLADRVQPSEEPQVRAQWYGAVAYAAACAGQHDRAWRAAEDALALTPIHRVVAELVIDVARSVVDAALLNRGRRSEASGALADGRLRRLDAELREVGLDTTGRASTRVVQVAFLVLQGERSRMDGSLDPQPWLEAAALTRLMPWPEREAYARLRAAEAFVALRQLADAKRELLEASIIARQLDTAPLRDEISGLAKRARIDLIDAEIRAGDGPTVREAATPMSRPADPFGLTNREQEVLRLLIEGRTNRQIGEQLFISPKTAGVHVSNILGKLGVTNRVEAAGVAHRLRYLT